MRFAKMDYPKVCEVTGRNKDSVQSELLSFVSYYPELAKKPWEDMYSENDNLDLGGLNLLEPRIRSSSSEDEHNDEEEELWGDEKMCRKFCLHCVYKMLLKYRIYVAEFGNIFYIYKFLLTLPMTQVTCERCFSKLKIIKNRLRSKMSDKSLETFMLTSSEKDILEEVSEEEEVIDALCKERTEMARLLSFSSL